MMENQEIGTRIRKIRNIYQLSQAELADKVAISACYLSMIESGKRQAGIELLSAIANEMQVSLEFFLE